MKVKKTKTVKINEEIFTLSEIKDKVGFPFLAKTVIEADKSAITDNHFILPIGEILFFPGETILDWDSQIDMLVSEDVVRFQMIVNPNIKRWEIVYPLVTEDFWEYKLKKVSKKLKKK